MREEDNRTLISLQCHVLVEPWRHALEYDHVFVLARTERTKSAFRRVAW